MTLPVAILAGGLATRMRPLTDSIPKALLDVVGKPFAIRQIELLREHGFEEIVWCLGHFGEQIAAKLGDGSSWGVSLKYVFDGDRPLGTGGALRKAVPLLGDAFVVLYGDSYLECDYKEIIEAFRARGTPALMTVYRNDGRWGRSNVVYENGYIRVYDKRNHIAEMKHIDYGVGVFETSILAAYPPDTVLDLAVIYQNLLAKGQLAGFEVGRRFYEIGSAEGLEETREFFKKKLGMK